MRGRLNKLLEELRSPEGDDPRLACLIQYLEPTARGLRACERLQVRTIADFLGRDQRDFITLRNCGRRTYEDLLSRVHQFLSHGTSEEAKDQDRVLNRALRDIITNPRAVRAFQALGIHTVGEFLDTPRETLLAEKGFGERTYWQVSRRIRALTEGGTDAAVLLPDSLLQFPLSELAVTAPLARSLKQQGYETVGALLEAPASTYQDDPEIGPEGVRQLRVALDRLVRDGIQATLEAGSDTVCVEFYVFLSRVLAVLDENQTRLFRNRVGLDCAPVTLPQLAELEAVTSDAAHALEDGVRQVLRQRVPALIDALRAEADQELSQRGGFVCSDRYTSGSLLHSAVESTGDRQLPLRLLQFFFPHDLFLYGNHLATLPPADYHEFCRLLRRATMVDRLPVPMTEVEQAVRAAVTPTPSGLLQHLLRQENLVLESDPEHGEVVQTSAISTPDRIHQILSDLARPTSDEDLLFAYRDRYGRANLKNLVDHLRKDGRFLEVGSQRWSLRSKHLDELSTARPEADRIVELLLDEPGQQNVFDLHREEAHAERTTYMVIECMRQDPRVRYLGEGCFCQRSSQSAVMEEIRQAIRRAMGELVASRFVANQPARRQRAVRCLFHHNRALISPAVDRIDLLTNYPFNAERMASLDETIRRHLKDGRGYASAAELVTALNETDLGGDWLTEFMLIDLVRRHLDYEMLPGGIIAQKELCLAGWIQQRAREVLRHAETALTPEGLLVDDPELAEFVDCLQALMDRDPMVQCVDGMRYAIV